MGVESLQNMRTSFMDDPNGMIVELFQHIMNSYVIVVLATAQKKSNWEVGISKS